MRLNLQLVCVRVYLCTLRKFPHSISLSLFCFCVLFYTRVANPANGAHAPLVSTIIHVSRTRYLFILSFVSYSMALSMLEKSAICAYVCVYGRIRLFVRGEEDRECGEGREVGCWRLMMIHIAD